MGMRAQVWWITGQTLDNRPVGKIWDWPRRENKRRGEELFYHDVDNFELTQKNLIRAPGSKAKKIRRGRGKYAHYGRTCGYGHRGAKKRGRRTINPGYEGGAQPIHIVYPQLLPEHKAMMRVDPFTPIYLKDLSMCDDGEEVDWNDLLLKGVNVAEKKLRSTVRVFQKTKVKATEDEEFTVKNLTVFAHAFEPPAREKIEANGGRCVRLHEWTSLPIDPDYAKVTVDDYVPEIGEGGEGEAEAAAEE
jgi:large subunit ribosomal protein L15